MSTTPRIPLSPIRPDFRRMDHLIWAVNASRYSTTLRGNRAHAADQGKGHAADKARLAEALKSWSLQDVTDYYVYDRHFAAIRNAA